MFNLIFVQLLSQFNFKIIFFFIQSVFIFSGNILWMLLNLPFIADNWVSSGGSIKPKYAKYSKVFLTSIYVMSLKIESGTN